MEVQGCNIIIYDFEVFTEDVLFGAYVLNDSGITVFQTWNLEEIKQFYKDNVRSIWFGWNIAHYDNLILQAVVRGCTEKQVKIVNDKIIKDEYRGRLEIPLFYYDLIDGHVTGLKTTEAFVGKNISETEVDFNIGRKLTEEEKRSTESYNRDDLQQTYENFIDLKGTVALRLDVISEFNLDLNALKATGTQLAEMVLHAERIDGIEKWKVKPELYPQLQIKNKDVIDFYLNEDFKTDKKLKVKLCGVEHQLGSGGIHGARKKYSTDWAYYFDVSGYYNLVMINYDLLPRSIPEEYRKFYKAMYEKQLELKKTAPEKRWTYKTILLSVFGAMTNKYCKFYDPYRGQLVTITGQIFLVDLLEKLEGKVELIQSNTDGIIAKPLEGTSEQELVDIIDEWQHRTGFVLKLEKIYNLHQRDVNCYFYQDAKGEVHTLGEAVNKYEKKSMFDRNQFNSKEPLIICYAIINYYIYGKSPEETINEYRDNLRMFQYICKKLSYDAIEYRETSSNGEVKTTKLQSVNRAFAMDDPSKIGMIYKYKDQDGKRRTTKVSNLPDSVFVYNDDIRTDEAKEEIQSKIDYAYYVLRSYERIEEFR